MKINKFPIIMYGALFITVTILLAINLDMKTDYENKINNMKETYSQNQNQLETYKKLYLENEKELSISNNKLSATENEFKEFKNKIAISSHKEKSISRGTTYDLTKFEAITVDDLNAYIKSKSPKDSPFINQGQVFIKASKESGLDPKFIFSLASLESSFGRSQIARDKNNYFGIAAYNDTPYQSAKHFGSGLEDGIVNGAIWIAKNYTYNGDVTIAQMQSGSKVYCQTDDGNPNYNWISQLLVLMN